MRTRKDEISRWHSSTWAWFVGLPVGLLILIIAGSVVWTRIRQYQQEVAQQRAVEQERQNRLQQEEYARQQRLEQQRHEAEEMRLRHERENRERIAKQQQEERDRQYQREEEKRQRRRRDQLEDEQRREQDRQRAESEAAARRAEEERKKEEQQRQAAEDKRRADLEKRGLPYYPSPQTTHEGKNAEQWYEHQLARPDDPMVRQRTIDALAHLDSEGVPFLMKLLQRYQKRRFQQGVDSVVRAIKPEHLHYNDLPALVDCLDDDYKQFTRMVVLERLAKHKGAKKHIRRIASFVDDLLKSEKYGADAQDCLDAIKAE
jgi:hypothetical protein